MTNTTTYVKFVGNKFRTNPKDLPVLAEAFVQAIPGPMDTVWLKGGEQCFVERVEFLVRDGVGAADIFIVLNPAPKAE